MNDRAAHSARWDPEATEPAVLFCEGCGIVIECCECPKCPEKYCRKRVVDCNQVVCNDCEKHEADCACEEAA